MVTAFLSAKSIFGGEDFSVEANIAEGNLNRFVDNNWI